MAVVWVIEKNKPSSLVVSLIGDFAVRAFASPMSFKNMLQATSHLRSPDCIVIDADDFGEQTKLLLAYCESDLIECRILVLFDQYKESNHAMRGSHVKFVARCQNVFDLTKEIKLCTRIGASSGQIRSIKDLHIDSKKMHLSIDGLEEDFPLSSKELQILLFFMDHVGRCVSRDDIRESVWNGLVISLRTIDTHISRLRKKLQASTVELKSVYGDGYILE